jgi:hypothetical protein
MTGDIVVDHPLAPAPSWAKSPEATVPLSSATVALSVGQFSFGRGNPA